MLNYRHPLTLENTIGESTVRLAERVRESITAPSWPSSCDYAFGARDSLLERVAPSEVPALLELLATCFPTDPALLA